MQKVGLIGLGTMGAGMAGMLLKTGFPLSLYNRRRDRAEPFEAQGARLAASPREAAQDCDVVIAMVSDDPASRHVWSSPEGALAGAKPGAILIECSTISPGWAKELAALASQQGCGFLDAPVTGSKVQAASGALRFLVGGDAETIHRAEPVLHALGNEIVSLGPVGSGALMKLINNMLCGVHIASLGEAVALIAKSGLDSDKAMQVLTGGAPGSPIVKAVSTRMANRDTSVHFSVRLMEKDLAYAVAEGRRYGATVATVEAALDAFRCVKEAGGGDGDIASVLAGPTGHDPT